jgi:hypothetical protein
MKNKIYKLSGITVLIFTLVTNLQYSFSDYGLRTGNLGSKLMAQGVTAPLATDEAEEGTETIAGGPKAQCYTIKTYNCAEGGVFVVCSFSGHYGDPTTCTDTGCGPFGGVSPRRCVKKVVTPP